MNKLFPLLVFCYLLSQSLFAQEITPPTPKKIPDTLVFHNDTIIDNYTWTKQKQDVDLVNYLYAENAYTDRVMKKTALLQQKLFNELRSRTQEEYQSIVIKKDSFYYYNRYEKDKDYAIYCRKKDSLTAPEQIYLDANVLSQKFNYFNLTGVNVSPNHRYLAYSVDLDGAEYATLFIKDLWLDTLLKENIPKTAQFIWAEDNQTIIYTLWDKKTKKSNRILSHKINTPITDDYLIFEEKRPKYSVGLGKTTSKEYLTINTSTFLTSETYYFSAKSPNTKPILFAKGFPKSTYNIDHFYGNEFIIYTNYKALNGKIMKAKIVPTPYKKWETVAAENDSVLIKGVHYFKDYMVFDEMSEGVSKIRVFNRQTKENYYLKVPHKLSTLSSIYFYKYNEQKLLYSYSDYTTPTQILEYDLITQKDSLIKEIKVKGYNPKNYTSKRIWVAAQDGAKIPLDLVYKNTTKFTDSTKLFLTAYASYGMNMEPAFDLVNISYLDRGFIVATAHPRGESLLGNQWYEKGKMLYKKNTYTDFIACTQFLVDSGYTSPSKLAIEGRSAGGMLMGAVTTMRPDLFQAVIAGVPYVDVLNGQSDTTLAGTKAHWDEIGNPNIKQQYDSIKVWDPYFNTTQQSYPNILILGGYNDPRVTYWIPTKWAMKLREKNTSKNLILLKTDMQGGHFGSSGRYDGLKESAMQLAFVLRSLGDNEDYITVKGVVKDENGGVLPYVNILVKGTPNGTTTNFDGEFQLNLKKGDNLELQFQYIGFKTHFEKITINSRISDLAIILKSEDIIMKEFEVKANAKDPAYGIIKHAIKRRKYHLKQVESYTADIYLKGTTRLLEIPEKMPQFFKSIDMPDSTDKGLLYLSESSARLYFEQPDNVKEEMFASKVSGFSGGYSWNRARDIDFNFYKNGIEIPYFSDRPFVSPIAKGAMIYYKYSLEGVIYEGNREINKIKVIPRRKGDPLFHGYIYIVENQWNIHSLDLILTKDAQIKFVDTLHFQQSYVPVTDSIWMPKSVKTKGIFKVFGFKASNTSLGVFSNYSVNKPFPPHFFNNEIFKINKGANKKDTVYWKSSRPITLTEEEQKNYHKGDSLVTLRNSPEYRDSVRKAHNKITVGDILISGGWVRLDSASYSFSPLINSIAFNTVEGWLGEFSGYYRNWKKGFYLRPQLRYGTSNKRPGARIKGSYTVDKKTSTYLLFSGGYYATQVNEQEPITNFMNTAYTLLREENYIKLYQKTHISFGLTSEVKNGLYVAPSVEYAHRQALVNTSNYNLVDRNSLDYTPNVPVLGFNSHNRAKVALQIKYRHKQKYESYPNFKWIKGSKYPWLLFNYEAGNTPNSSSNIYQHISVGINDKMKLGQLGKSTYSVEFGAFINKTKMSFMDYKHFLGNRTIFINNQPNSFQTLSYYDFSTNQNYGEVHFVHQFNGFILSKIPMLRKAKFQTLGGFNAMFTKNTGYTELFIGLENIFGVMRFDIAGTYSSTQKFKPQIRIGIDLDLVN